MWLNKIAIGCSIVIMRLVFCFVLVETNSGKRCICGGIRVVREAAARPTSCAHAGIIEEEFWEVQVWGPYGTDYVVLSYFNMWSAEI